MGPSTALLLGGDPWEPASHRGSEVGDAESVGGLVLGVLGARGRALEGMGPSTALLLGGDPWEPASHRGSEVGDAESVGGLVLGVLGARGRALENSPVSQEEDGSFPKHRLCVPVWERSCRP